MKVPILGVLFDRSDEDERDREGLAILDPQYFNGPATPTTGRVHVRLYWP